MEKIATLIFKINTSEGSIKKQVQMALNFAKKHPEFQVRCDSDNFKGNTNIFACDTSEGIMQRLFEDYCGVKYTVFDLITKEIDLYSMNELIDYLNAFYSICKDKFVFEVSDIVLGFKKNKMLIKVNGKVKFSIKRTFYFDLQKS